VQFSPAPSAEAYRGSWKIMIDVNLIRNPDILMYRLDRADDVYTIYYDETNNIRRLHITPDGLNVREPKCFVLGGIARKGPTRDLGFESLRFALRLQKSAKEMKLQHLGKGEFPQLLGSAKVEIFLRWILDAGLFIHFQALDIMYWSIVDIVDSIVTEAGHAQLMMIAPALKDDLYTVLRYDHDHTVDLFKRYSYPNVGKDKRSAFISELMNLLEDRRDLLPDFNFQMLKGLLRIAAKLESLPYLEDEEPNVLINEFSTFYIKRICLFKNSTHILDVEEVIKARLAEETFLDEGCSLQNYRFVDSRNETSVQIADAITGLLGKCFSFLNRSTLSDLNDTRLTLSPVQSRNLSLLAALIDRSIAENAAFASYVLSNADRCKSAFFLDPKFPIQ
jgi:hypothetical protein